jgi:hypothetical protein
MAGNVAMCHSSSMRSREADLLTGTKAGVRNPSQNLPLTLQKKVKEALRQSPSATNELTSDRRMI